MDLYGQEAEARLLAELLPCLGVSTVVDVGAEHGELSAVLLEAGSEVVHAIEPEPSNLQALRDRFGADNRVVVHAYAASDHDGMVDLHISASPDGTALSFGHTVLDRPDTNEIAWTETIAVPSRSLGSMVDSGELPQCVGVVKIDTEGHDLAVLRGMGKLDCDVVMVEHWTDLPQSLGRCPWRIADVRTALATRGFSHFAFVMHRREFVVLKWNDSGVPPGAMGNLVFLNDRIADEALPILLETASRLADSAVELAELQASAAAERLILLEELDRERQALEQAAAERLDAITSLTRAAEEQGKVIEKLTRAFDDSAQRASPTD